MKPLPKAYRREQIAQALRQGIRGGEWSTWLPSERMLSQHFQVGRDQIHQAIRVLREEGLLELDGRRNRVVRHTRPRTGDRSVTILTPWRLEEADRIFLYIVDRLREGLEADHIRFHIESSPAVQQQRPERGLRRLADRHPDTLWLLHLAPPRVQDWFYRQGVPGLILGTGGGENRFPFLDVDQAAAARHAVGVLRRAGHAPEELLFVRPQADLYGLDRMAEGLAEALGGPPLTLTAPETLATLAARLARRSWTGRNASRAILSAGTREALFLHGWIHAHAGLRIGQDISLCCLSDHRGFKALCPPMDHYTMRSPAYARQLLRITRRLIASRFDSVSTSNLVVPEYVPGASICNKKRR